METMKKIIIFMLFLMLVFAFSACDNGVDDQGSGEAKNTEAAEEYNLGNYEITFGEAAFGQDYNEAKCIIVSYEFSNYSEETTSSLYETYAQAFQDGIELTPSFTVDYPDSEWEDMESNSVKEIRPGKTILVCTSFVLTSDSPVEVEITGCSDDNDNLTVTKTYEITN